MWGGMADVVHASNRPPSYSDVIRFFPEQTQVGTGQRPCRINSLWGRWLVSKWE